MCRMTLESYARKAPASPALLDMRARVAPAQGDYAAGSRMLSQLRAAQRTSPGWQARTSFTLSRVSRLTGHLEEAERFLREKQSESEARGAPGDYVGGAVERAFLELDFRARPDSAASILAAALAKYPLASIPAPDRPYPGLVAFYAKAESRTRRAGSGASTRRRCPTAPARRPVPPLAAAALAEAERHPDEAEAEYGKWYNEGGECSAAAVRSGAARGAAGRTDSALALYDRGLATPSLRRYMLDAYELAAALKRAGELYEAKGERAKAADRYRRFVDLWKDADPELQPGVREVRARLARLDHGARHLTPAPPALDDRSLLARLVAFDSTSHASNLPLADFLCRLSRPAGRPHRAQPLRRREQDQSGRRSRTRGGRS